MTCAEALQHTATHCDTLQHTAAHCNTLQHTATHCHTLQCTATRSSTLYHSTAHCTLRHTAAHCNTLQHTATHCNTLQHTATHCNTPAQGDMPQPSQVNTATHCNTPQHTATHQHKETCHNQVKFIFLHPRNNNEKTVNLALEMRGNALETWDVIEVLMTRKIKVQRQCVAVCCSVLQCVAGCCSVL